MSKKGIAVVAAIIAGILLLCACVGTAGYIALNTPLGPALQAKTPNPFLTPDIAIGSPEIPSASTTAPIPTPTAGQAEHCGMKGSVNFLIMGVDSPFGDGFKGPLAIRLIKMDFSQKTVTVFSFPKDLWIPVHGLESHGITHSRLGELYLIGRSNAGLNEAAATNLVAQNLGQNFGTVSNQYIVGKLTTLAAIIDTVGGITVTIPVPHDATAIGMHYFPAGPYRMNGLSALEYAVAPTSAGQWDGFDRQTLVLSTLYQKMLSPENLSKLPVLIPQFLQAVATDMTLQQMLNLLCISQQIPKEQMIFAEVAPEDVTLGPSGVQYPNTEAIRAKVRQYLSPS